MSQIVRSGDGEVMLSGDFACAAQRALSFKILTPLPGLAGYAGILCRGAWAERDGGPAKLAELDAAHGGAVRRAESARVEEANAKVERDARSANSADPLFRLTPEGVDISAYETLFAMRAAELEVECRDLMRAIHRAAIRDSDAFEVILAAIAAVAQDHGTDEVVISVLEGDLSAEWGAPATRAAITAKVRGRIAEGLADPDAVVKVGGTVRGALIVKTDLFTSTVGRGMSPAAAVATLAAVGVFAVDGAADGAADWDDVEDDAEDEAVDGDGAANGECCIA